MGHESSATSRFDPQINAAGEMSDDQRNETQLLLANLGAESLVEETTHSPATAPAILGPSWRNDAPRRAMGDTIAAGVAATDDRALVRGRVLDAVTGAPVPHAELDVRQPAPRGLDEQQAPQQQQPDTQLRGRFTTGADGGYRFYCLRPTGYPIPIDGPAGEVLRLLDRHPWRPAHIRFFVTAAGYKPLLTRILDREGEFVGAGGNVALAVEEGSVVDFAPVEVEGEGGQGPAARFELEYDFRLARAGGGEAGSGATPVAL